RLHDAAGPLLDPDQPASWKVLVWPRLDHGRPLPFFKLHGPNIGTQALFDPAALEVETWPEPRLQKSSRNQRVAQRPDVYEVKPRTRFLNLARASHGVLWRVHEQLEQTVLAARVAYRAAIDFKHVAKRHPTWQPGEGHEEEIRTQHPL